MGTCLLIRTCHTLTESSLRRIRIWIKQLTAHSIDVWISIDCSKCGADGDTTLSGTSSISKESLFEMISKNLGEFAKYVRIHEYTESDMMRVYPAIIEIQIPIVNVPPPNAIAL